MLWSCVFLFSVDAKKDEFYTTLSLLQNNFVGPSIRMSNILNLKWRAVICSTQHFAAMNSLKNVLDLTVFCCSLYHAIGEQLMNNMNLVWLYLVTSLAACDTSTYATIPTDLPRGVGVSPSGGNSSCASLCCSWNVLMLSEFEIHVGSMDGCEGLEWISNSFLIHNIHFLQGNVKNFS